MRHNCNHFSNELSTFLTGSGIPSDILELPERVLRSPLGAMLAPLIEQMETGMRGNQVPSQALFNAPPLDFSSVRPPVQTPANPPRTPVPTPATPSQSGAAAPALTPTAGARRPSHNVPVVGTPATPHLANLNQTLQTPAAPAKGIPSPATAQELRALSAGVTPASTSGAQAGASLTGPRAAAAAAAEARARSAAAATSISGSGVQSEAKGVTNENSGNGKSLNVSREVVQKEVKAEFAEVMKEGKVTPNQAAAIALARVLERHSLESPNKKGVRDTEARG